MKKLLVIGLVLLLWVGIAGSYFGVFGESNTVAEIFNKYNTLPKFEQYVTDNIAWKYKGYYLSNKPKTPEQTLKDKGGICGDFAFLYKEYLKRTYTIESTVIAFKYYKKRSGTGLHAIGLFKHSNVYWVTENNRVIRTAVPDMYTIKEFLDTYDVAWVHFRMYHKSGSLRDKVTNTKTKKELKAIAKNPDKTYRVKRSERYANGDF